MSLVSFGSDSSINFGVLSRSRFLFKLDYSSLWNYGHSTSILKNLSAVFNRLKLYTIRSLNWKLLTLKSSLILLISWKKMNIGKKVSRFVLFFSSLSIALIDSIDRFTNEESISLLILSLSKFGIRIYLNSLNDMYVQLLLHYYILDWWGCCW